MTRIEILRILNELHKEIQNRFKTNVKGIVGSYARGNARPESDIDVLVDFLPGATLFDYTGVALFLEERLHQRVDVVPERDIRRELRPMMLAEAVYL